MKQKVYLAHEESYCNELIALFNGSEEFECIGASGNGEIALREIKTCMPDVVIMDILLTNIDGFSLLSAMSTLPYRPKTIVVSAMNRDTIIDRAIKAGATYYMVKPVGQKALLDRVRELARGEFRGVSNRNLDERISNIFITVGIPAHIKGYQFLREAIKMVVDTPEIINSITKKLYPSIAERFDTSSSKVERAIRHAIEVAWSRGKIENINTMFGIKIYTSNDKSTNGEFIALVADKMLIEGIA